MMSLQLRQYESSSRSNDEVANGLLRPRRQGVLHSVLESAIRAPLTAASTVGPRALFAARTTATRGEAASPSEPNAPERLGRREPIPKTEGEFKVLYDTHFLRVSRELSRFGVRDADLMDLTQKVFLTAYLKLPEFEGRSLLSTWLWGICRRVALAYRRLAAIRYEVATDPSSLEISTEQHWVAASEVDSTRQVAAELILSKLPEPQRIVFTLFEVDELDGSEIAALLNISLGTVRSRLRYARKVCRREVRRLALVSAFAKTQSK
jgi:RNA polymerase sigma-70 factor (ECF subfamily)